MDATKKAFVSNKDETPRMFKSDMLETLTKVHPVTPVIIFVPVIGWLLYKAYVNPMNHTASILTEFAVGIIFWTFFEYTLHKKAFHFIGESAFAKKMHFLFHGIHHDYPRDSWRLVMPPTVSIGLSFLIFKTLGFLFKVKLVFSYFR